MRQGQESVCTQITIMIINEQLGKNLQRRYVSAQIYFKKEKKKERINKTQGRADMKQP